ncbi:MAG TPA: 1-acyl-sn-glycerol-3-phosphate acyltransferase [Anaeromyxobacteraceae bacterium]|nr:1-acyl-sn-glycerol-3-phosphate acyltransferase [Anaeromyxobacteraceae bacterium]
MSAPDPTPTPDRPARRSWLDHWFGRVQIPAEAVAEIRELSRRGSLVFVMRSSGMLNFLFVRWWVRRLGLPPLRASVGSDWLIPTFFGVRRTRRALDDAISRGNTSVVFLNTHDHGHDPFTALCGRQRTLSHPVFLVPLLLVWSRRAQRLKPPVWELIYGSPEAPTAIGVAVAFLRYYRRAFLRVGRAAAIQDFVRERADEPDAVLGRKVRGTLYHHLAREMRAALGPPLKDLPRIRERVLRDRHLAQVIEHVSRTSGKSTAALQREALKALDEIAARYSPLFIELVRPILGWVFNRIYDRVEVDWEGLNRVRRAASEAPLVLCPSHKSHIDYLILSWVFYENGLTPPHVAAGVNLAFWPFGWIARRGGAFFIRRSFKGDKIYSATLRAYVKFLLRERYAQEFFVEGGRSRTGKLLFPKTGLISMEVDAWLDGAADDVRFVPIAVDYERLVEGKSYQAELSGGEKEKESFGALLRTPRVLLKRWGPIYLQFGEPVSLKTLAQQHLREAATSLTLDGEERETDSKRRLVQAVAARLAHRINRVITISPMGLVAAALLSHQRRGIPAEEVARRVELLRVVAQHVDARFARGLADASADPRQAGPVAEALAKLEKDGLVRAERAAGQVIYQVPDEARPQLDYFRNNALHRYVSVSMIAAALRASGGAAPLGVVRGRTRWLSRLLKLEFMYRPGATFDSIFDEYGGTLARLGVVALENGTMRAGAEREMLDFVADLTRPYLEAYGLAARTLLPASQSGDALDRRSLVKAALERGRADFLAGRILQRESLSKATLENAFEWLSQQGALAIGPDGKRGLDPRWKSSLLTELNDEIARHLPA